MRIELTQAEIEHPQGLEIAIAGFKGDVGSTKPAQVFIEFYAGQLQVYVWDGDEDPAATFTIPALAVTK